MRLRLPQLLLAAMALLMLAPCIQAQDDNTPLGDVARKTKIANSNQKPKVTLDEDNTPEPGPPPAAAPATATNAGGAAQPAATAQPNTAAAPAPVPCFDTCDGPPPGKTAL